MYTRARVHGKINSEPSDSSAQLRTESTCCCCSAFPLSLSRARTAFVPTTLPLPLALSLALYIFAERRDEESKITQRKERESEREKKAPPDRVALYLRGCEGELEEVARARAAVYLRLARRLLRRADGDGIGTLYILHAESPREKRHVPGRSFFTHSHIRATVL